MSFPKYEAYKDSGVEWLGEVPKHWILGALKYFVKPIPGAIKTGPFGSHLKSDEMTEGPYKVFNQRNVIDSDFNAGDNYITETKFQDLFAFRTFPGDILVTTRGTIGRAAILPMDAEEGVLHPCLLRVQVEQSKLQPNYLRRLIQESHLLKTQLALMSNATTIEVIYSDTMASLILSVPPLEEQTQIARFLDHETARIDALIAEQQRLIELLKEKRQAVISHAVTKGLDPTAPMKDSGVEWLGEVPAHWTVSKVKYEFKNLDSKRIPLSAEERGEKQGGYPYYGASGIIDHVDEYIFDDDLVLVSEDGANLLMRNYPIAFVATGRYWVNNHAHILKPLRDLNVDYWAQIIELADLTSFISGSAQPKFTAEALGNLSIAFPPTIEERAQINNLLREKISGTERLLSESKQNINFLQERRSALISAAVTGKIDVRGWQAPASAAPAPTLEPAHG